MEILKNAKKAKNGKFELVFRRVDFVSLVGPSESVGGCFAFDSSEDLGGFGCLEVEIMKKPKKVDFWFDFRRFGFVSLVVPSEGVGGCSGGDGGVDLAALWGLRVKKSKYGRNFAFWVVFDVSVVHRSS